MAKTYKRLGATAVTAATDTGLYTVPASTSTIVGAIIVCNKGASQRTYRIALVDGAIGDVAAEDYIAYDTTINPNTTTVLNIGIAMAATNTLLVRASHAEVTFMATGVEIS